MATIPLQQEQKRIEARRLRFNVFAFLVDYITYFAGVSLLSSVTILPLFASEVADRSKVLAPHRAEMMALIPALFAFGLLLPQLLGARLVTGRSVYRPFVVRCGILERSCVLLHCLSIPLLAHASPVLLFAVPIGFYFLWSAAMGVNHPAYMAMQEHTVPSEWRGRLFGVGATIGGGVGFLLALAAKYFLRVFPFPYGFFACGVAAFVVLAAGLVPLAFVHETPSPQPEQDGPVHVRLAGIWKSDVPFRRYLLSQVLFALQMMTAALWTGYALKRFQARQEDVAVMAAVLALASGVGFLPIGYLADRFGNRAVLLWSTVLTGLTTLAAFLAPTLPLYIASLAPSMIANCGWQLTSFNILMDFAPRGRVHTYTAASALVTGPLRALAPMLGGVLVTEIGRHGPVFLLAALAALGSAALVAFVPEPREIV